ncbi:hypothetical protein DPEC_G00356500 [Dallia pectoralis]|uniref:Uncharacterized protein n=1 Tax=Dallia pectoralis TaxID=75939 RepID=A0ACC2EZS7_DALPE|nr:hypothetical protein DPEC_G00356500 [Dallia pectoralis]
MKCTGDPERLENVLPLKAQEEEDKERVVLGQRPEREKQRQGGVTKCEVCNIQLNSCAQAQIHNNGKTHQRKLRQFKLAKASSPAHTGTGHIHI